MHSQICALHGSEIAPDTQRRAAGARPQHNPKLVKPTKPSGFHCSASLLPPARAPPGRAPARWAGPCARPRWESGWEQRRARLLNGLARALGHDAVQVGLVVHDLLGLDLDVHRLRAAADPKRL
jgi:hypothetical protein